MIRFLQNDLSIGPLQAVLADGETDRAFEVSASSTSKNMYRRSSWRMTKGSATKDAVTSVTSSRVRTGFRIPAGV